MHTWRMLCLAKGGSGTVALWSPLTVKKGPVERGVRTTKAGRRRERTLKNLINYIIYGRAGYRAGSYIYKFEGNSIVRDDE